MLKLIPDVTEGNRRTLSKSRSRLLLATHRRHPLLVLILLLLCTLQYSVCRIRHSSRLGVGGGHGLLSFLSASPVLSPHTLRFNCHFPGEPGLAGCPLNSPPFIPRLHLLLGQA